MSGSNSVRSDITEVQFRALANSLPNLAWMADADGWVFWYNDRWYEYTGTTPEEMVGWGWQSVHHPEVLPEMIQRWTRALETGEPFEMTFPLRRGADGSFRTFMTRAEPLREDGQIVAWLGTNTDITEQERTRERLQLVINELNHRVKNILATVQSIAHSSFGKSDRDAFEVFERRVISLAKVQELLTRQQWAPFQLAELIELELGSLGRERFRLSGDDVQIEPRLGGPLAMVLHELGTNAMKHGALSSETGSVEITWHTESLAKRRWLTLSWVETGGPKPVQTMREGFGLKLIRRLLTAERGSLVEHVYTAEGLRYVARFPFSEEIIQ